MNEPLGSRVPRLDGYAKVTGQALYGDDIKMKNLLHGVCRYVDIVAGTIDSIDLIEAKAVPGVVHIATYDDIPGLRNIGVVIPDYPPIIKDEVIFQGDVVAVIAAETHEAACLASERIKITYTSVEPITDVEEALRPGARLIHRDNENNIINHHHTIKGDIDKGFAASAHIFEREYEVGYQEHAYIEPESIVTYIDPNEQVMTVTGSIQNAHRVRGMVAQYLNLPQSKVNVKRAIMGGSFGGKDDIIDNLACRASLLTHLTKRPVKISYNREQSMRESYKRHPYKMKYKIGLDDDARIQAIKIDILADGGSYAGQTPFVTWRSSVQAAGPYNIPNVRIDITGVYTNNNYTSAFRGFGAPQVIFANESLMDEVAAHFNISPVEIRRRNILKQGDTSIAGQVFSEHTVSAEEVLQKGLEHSDYFRKIEEYKRLNAQGGPIKYGIGFAISHRGCSLGAEGLDASSALIQVNADGSINISTSVSENGQGLQTSMALICAQAFGVSLDTIKFSEPATAMIADGGSTVASRGTLMGGQAILSAANKIKRRMAAAICSKLDLDARNLDHSSETSSFNDIVWEGGKVYNRANPSKTLTFQQVVDLTKATGANVSAYGWHVAPAIHWDEEKGTGSPYFTWVYGCQVADIAVNTSTGKITVLNATAVHDVGKVVNRVGFEGQVYGGVLQGMIGYGMLEDFNIERGKVKSENFDSYLLPTIKDMPKINVVAVENYDKAGPFGAKVIGEPVLELGAAALNSALNFAVEKWNYQLPLTLEQVKLGYNLKKPARQSELMVESVEKKQTLRLTKIELLNSASVEDALSMLQQKNASVLAGGTDELVQARMKTGEQVLVNISHLSALKQITEKEGCIHIGGAVCFSDLVDHPLLQQRYPLLVEACQTIGSLQIRNRATVGGNIVNAAPCADSVPPLMAYDAEVLLQSAKGARRMLLTEFIVSGYRTQLNEGELLTEVILPIQPDRKLIQKYSQLGRRNALNITRISLTAILGFDASGKIDYCRLVDGALMSKPQRLTAVENALLGRPLTEENIKSASSELNQLIEKEIGGRWSAAYKQPTYLDMFRDLINSVRDEL